MHVQQVVSFFHVPLTRHYLISVGLVLGVNLILCVTQLRNNSEV